MEKGVNKRMTPEEVGQEASMKASSQGTGAAPAPEIERSDYQVDLQKGLTHAQVEERRAQGKTNVDDVGQTKSVKQIILGNICTLFNLINLILAVAILIAGSYKNVTFMGIIIANTAIGIFQEIRSKRTMDRLSFLSASKVKVIREGQEEEVISEEIVQDDLMVLEAGNQVQADSVVLEGVCNVDGPHRKLNGQITR